MYKQTQADFENEIHCYKMSKYMSVYQNKVHFYYKSDKGCNRKEGLMPSLFIKVNTNTRNLGSVVMIYCHSLTKVKKLGDEKLS